MTFKVDKKFSNYHGLIVYATRESSPNFNDNTSTEFLFYDESSGWYWDDADDYSPIIRYD